MTLKDTNTIKIYSTTKSNIFQKETPGTYRMEDVETEYRRLLNLGYTIYDVKAEGGFTNLGAKTAGKYICVWKNTTIPTSAYSIPASAISPHTDVVIMSATVDASYNLLSVGNEITLGTALSGDYSKLTFRYSTLTYSATGTTSTSFNVNMENTYFKISNIRYTCVFNKMLFNKVYLDVDMTASFTLSYYSDTYRTIDDSYIKAGQFSNVFNIDITNTGSSASTGYNEMNNTLIDVNIDMSVAPTAVKYLNFNNVYFKQSLVRTVTIGSNLRTTNNSVIYCTYRGYVVSNSYKAVELSSYTPYESLDKLNTTLLTGISGTSTEFNCSYTYLRKNQLGELGNIKYQYYILDFIENMQVPDTHKYFDIDDVFITYRPDILTTLDVNKYNKFQLLKDTTVTTNRTDESFLLLVQYGSSIEVVGYHKGKCYPTIYSTVSPFNYAYDIILAFQIWEFPEELQYKNKYNIANSPLVGSFTVKDHTSRCIKGI